MAARATLEEFKCIKMVLCFRKEKKTNTKGWIHCKKVKTDTKII